MSRRLYDIPGDTISDVYSSNLNNDIQLPMSDMLARIVVHEQRLAEWRHRPWEATVKDADPSNLVFHKLSIVMILRYLSTRIFLHRPILSASLHGVCRAQDFPPDSRGLMSPQSKQRLFSPELAELSIKT
ncbi:hypothetical protein H0G86_011934 [Trichoderma simmonsii]|uniref:Uncharacterized protein n=1 Tax=Trichoderma simmonsii TaxID=1491479 RepID=A0A8G0LMJ7_9HYPO|nr:hypothetical protein H0G86_011934 [Trichoderma simmonsii]